jgi:hemoglobin-like flavoprotein
MGNLTQELRIAILDINQLQASFARIEPHKEAFAAQFYTTLLENYPALRPFFVNVDLKRQQSSLLATLLALLNETSRGDELRAIFQRLGQRHADRQIRAEHYPAFGQTLLDTMAFYDPQWTPELRAAWASTLEQCVRFMMESYHPEATVYRVQVSRARR